MATASSYNTFPLIPRLMKERGYAENEYKTKERYMVLKPNATRTINVHNEIWFIHNVPDNITIKSLTGYFDTEDQNVDELCTEFNRTFDIINKAGAIQHVIFIQIIPTRKRNKKG